MYHQDKWETYYCADPKCEGSEGFMLQVTPASRWEPAYLDIDYCPHCGGEIRDRPPIPLEDYDDY